MAPRCPVPLQGGPAFLPGVSLGGDWTREVSLCTWAVGRPHTLSAVRGAVGCDPGHPLPPSSSGLPEGSALVHRREDGNRPPRGLSGGKGCVCHVTPWMGQPSRSTGCLQSGKPTLGRQHILTSHGPAKDAQQTAYITDRSTGGGGTARSRSGPRLCTDCSTGTIPTWPTHVGKGTQHH